MTGDIGEKLSGEAGGDLGPWQSVADMADTLSDMVRGREVNEIIKKEHYRGE